MTTQELASTLSAISSGQPALLMQAEQRINEWQTQPGFYTELAKVFSSWSVFDEGIRLQAVLLCKNIVDRRWRPLAPNALSELDKNGVREALVKCIDEPLDSLATHESVLLGKIARLDVPRVWPDLVPGLIHAVSNNAEGSEQVERVRQRRALLFLYTVTKSLSSKRLAADRRVFHQLTSELLLTLLKLWNQHHNAFIQHVTDGKVEEARYSLAIAHLVLKLLRKCVVHGLTKCHENETVLQFLNHLLRQIKVILPLRNEKTMTSSIEKYTVLHLKLLTDMLDVQPLSFVVILQSTLKTLFELVFSSDNNICNLLFDRFVIFSLNIIKTILNCPEYKPPRSANISATALSIARSSNGGFSAKQSFFTHSILNQMLFVTVLNYLPMRAQDLSQWDEDPEAFFSDEEAGDSWRYTYRPCVESFFVTLFKCYRSSLASKLIDLLKQHSQPIDASDLKAVLTKDAVYNAVGLVAYDLYDEIDFDSWLLSGLEAELNVKASNYRVVRRRAAWLLGQWSGVKLSPALRPKLYDMLLPLLSTDEDLAIRLASSKALKVVVDDFEFRSTEIEPYISTLFFNLIVLLKQVNEADTKLSVLSVLSCLIERMGPSISGHIGDLVLHLPHLWDASEEHNLLRCAIINATSSVLHSLGSRSEELLNFVVPLIEYSTDINESSSVYMMEDGLDLWLAALHNAKQLHPRLANLARLLPGLIEMGTEHLENVLYIIQAYVFMAPSEVIGAHGQSINASLTSLYADLNVEGVTTILRLLELLLRLGPPHETTQVFQTLIATVIRELCPLSGDEEAGSGYELRFHSNVLSRLLLVNMEGLQDIVVLINKDINDGKNDNDRLYLLLDNWSRRVIASQHEHEKLQALACCQLLRHINNELISKLVFRLITNIVEALCDITTQDEPQSPFIDTLVKTEADLQAERDDPAYLSHHELRRLAFAAADPIHNVDLLQCFQQTMGSLKNVLGDQVFNKLLNEIDVETLTTLKVYVKL